MYDGDGDAGSQRLWLEGKAIANPREDKAFCPAMLPCSAGELEV